MVSYHTYKNSTVKVVSWICQTAENNGSATRTNANPTQNGTSRTTTQEIWRQAQYLAALEQDIFVMSHTVWRHYKVMLAGRRQYLARYADDVHAAEANAGHAYFVRTMVEIQELLRDRVSVQVTTKAKLAKTPSASTLGTLGSLHDDLKMEDTDQDVDIPDDVSEASVASSAGPIYVPDVFTLEQGLQTWWNIFLGGYWPLHEYLDERLGETEYLEGLPLYEYVDDRRADTGNLGNDQTNKYNQYSSFEPAACAFLTEVAVTLLGQQEEDIYKARDALSALTGHGYILPFAMNPSDPGYFPSLTLRDVTALRRIHGQSYLLPLKPLGARHPNIKYAHEDQALIKRDSDAALGHFMMELNLDCQSRETFSASKPLLSTSQDKVSKVLHKVNLVTDDESTDRILVQATFCAQLLALWGIVSQPRVYCELLQTCEELNDIVAEVDKRIALNPDCDTLCKQLKATIVWVNEWPVPSLRHQKVNEVRKDPVKQQQLRGRINFRADDAFLRKANLTLSGKHRLTLLVQAEEFGLALINSARFVQPMCYLYMTVTTFGLFTRKGFGYPHEQSSDMSNLVMKGVDLICQRHKKDVFGGEFPSKPHLILKLMKLKTGRSILNFAQPTAGRSIQPQFSSSSWKLHTHPTVSILREYFHEKITMLEMIHIFDREVQAKEPRKNRRKSLLEDQDMVPFLKKIQPMIEEAINWLQFDYLTVHCVCMALFRKIHIRMRIEGVSLHESFHNITEPGLRDWKNGTDSAIGYAYCIASSVIQELDLALHKESLMDRGKTVKAKIATPLLDVATSVLKEYCETVGEGFAD